MVEFENQCVDCGLPCLGDSCPNRHVPVFYCDECGCHFDASELYVVDDSMLCKDCLADTYRTVEQVGIDKFSE